MDCIEPVAGLRIYFEPIFRGVVQINEHGEIIGKKQETKMYCKQCYGSYNDSKKCLNEYCELRWIETGNLRKKEPKMTREEAIKKVDDGRGASANSNEWLVKALDALGVLKFEEEKEESVEAIITAFVNGADARIIIAGLNCRGYLIVKIGKETSIALDQGHKRIGISGKLINIRQEQS